MDDSKRLDFGFDSGRGMSLDYAGSGMDRGLPDFSIHGHLALRGKAMAIIFVPGPHRLLALNFWNRI